jgi:two-component system chemotaxis response regulator CheB
LVAHLSHGEKENFCRPAADPMLRSLVALAGAATLAVVLTGMGHDGMAGCEAVVKAGGTVLAQDESTSVVWGMPGAVAQRGLCAALASPETLGEMVGHFIKTGRLS